jgi:hypothetical protein
MPDALVDDSTHVALSRLVTEFAWRIGLTVQDVLLQQGEAMAASSPHAGLWV